MEGRLLGRYEVLSRLASGGMAEVYVGRAVGVAGFERLVAIKVLHPNLAYEPEFISMFLDEARLAARIRHPNVVPTLDINDTGGDGYFLVMDYVEGSHLGTLIGSEAQAGRRLPVDVVLRIVMDALAGLGAAHALCDDDGRPLHIVHRDVSPHNLMVGADGICRLTDFGVAKAEIRLSSTRAGQFKGKLGYMAPEHAATGESDQRADLFSMGIILWEALTGSRLFRGKNNTETLNKVLSAPIPPPSARAPDLRPFDALLARALDRDSARRFQSADEFMEALESVARQVGGAASSRLVAQHVVRILGPTLEAQRTSVKAAIDALGKARVAGDFMPAPRQSEPGRLSVVPPPPAAPADPGPARPAERLSLDPAQGLAPGTIVDGRYRIDSVLGKGGNGIVYGATHTMLRKRVALKALREDMAVTAEMAARFEQEARSASAMGHPNIVDVTDFGHLPDGRSYFVMEQLEGCTLRDRLKRGALPTDEAVRIAVQVASALSAAHSQQVIHRDLKPENIFLVKRGADTQDAKVLDFGVAKVASASRITHDNVVFGTPQYMSPEQASGETVDTRTDVYALGIILYEMLTGAVPFNGDTFMNVLYKHRSEPPPGHVRLTRDEPHLGRVVLRALSKQPEQRYQDMSAFIADLPEIERVSHVVVAPRGSSPGSAGKTARSRGSLRVVGWAAFGALALALSGAFAFVAIRQLSGQRSGSLAGTGDHVAGAHPSRGSQPASATVPVQVPVLPTGSNRPAAEAPASAHPAPPQATDPSEPSALEGHEVRISSTPEGAMVEMDGALIGNTPLLFHLPDSLEEARLTLTLSNYRDVVVAVTHESPPRIQVDLSGSGSSSSRRSGSASSTATSDRPNAPANASQPEGTRPPRRAGMNVALDVVDPWE